MLGDVDRLRLDVEVDDEVFGALAGRRGVSSRGLPAASVRPGYCSSVVWATNVYWPAGKPGSEGQVDVAVVGEDVSCSCRR